MKRRRPIPEVVGTPFLDLVCCAFGGILLLFMLAPREDGTPTPVMEGAQIIAVDARDGEPHRIGARITIAGESNECWPPHGCPPSRAADWDATTLSSLVVAVRGTKATGKIDIAIMELAPGKTHTDPICVRVSEPGGSLDRSIKLTWTNGYRASVPVTGTGSTC